MSEDELAEDLSTLVALTRTDQEPAPIKRSLIHYYTFDTRQQSKVKRGDKLELLHAAEKEERIQKDLLK